MAVQSEKACRIDFGCSSSGWQGDTLYESADIRGNTYGSSDEEKFAHIPSMSFEFSAIRAVELPQVDYTQQFPNEREYFEKFGVTPLFPVGDGDCNVIYRDKDEGRVREQIGMVVLPKAPDFYEFINGSKGEQNFFPFLVEAREDVMPEFKTWFKVKLRIEIGRRTISATVPANHPNLAVLVQDVIRTFETWVDTFDLLKPHYRHTDDEGNRLWVDRGLQSDEFYEAGAKIRDEAMKEFRKLLERHRIRYFYSGRFRAYIGNFISSVSEYGMWRNISFTGAYLFEIIRLKIKGEKIREFI